MLPFGVRSCEVAIIWPVYCTVYICMLHPPKVTWQWNITIFNTRYILKWDEMGVFPLSCQFLRVYCYGQISMLHTIMSLGLKEESTKAWTPHPAVQPFHHSQSTQTYSTECDAKGSYFGNHGIATWELTGLSYGLLPEILATRSQADTWQ